MHLDTKEGVGYDENQLLDLGSSWVTFTYFQSVAPLLASLLYILELLLDCI